MLNINRYDDNTNIKKSYKILNISLTHLTMSYPVFLSEKETKPIVEIIDLIQNSYRSEHYLFHYFMLSNINNKCKKFYYMDGSMANFEKMQKEWTAYIKTNNYK